jgi:hypothetical protein
MPVAPAYGGGGNGFGFGNNGDWAWIILLLLLGWGNNGWGGNGFDGGAGGLYPWMNQSNQMSDGFRDQMISGNINSIRDSIGGISTQLCNGFAGVNAGVANGFAQAEIAANGRQMANMNQNFALQSQLAECCCENRLATADLKYTVATENCADRYEAAQNARDIIDSQTRGTQAILDKLCQLELDGVKSELSAANNTIGQLRTQLVLSQEQASQVAQTGEIINGVYSRLSSCPVGTTPVYGNQPIFTCGGNGGCGCGGSF